MACKTMTMRYVFSAEAWRSSSTSFSACSASSRTFRFCRKHQRLEHGFGKAAIRRRDFEARRNRLNCSHRDQGPPQEAVLKAISEVSRSEGRVGQTTNVVIGGTVADDSTNEWLVLDKKVNAYPTERRFTAIGTGGDDFVHAMVGAVESVIQQPIPEDCVRQKLSSRGKYVSVKIGPIQVVSSEQVQAVYNAMKRDDRMKYFL